MGLRVKPAMTNTDWFTVAYSVRGASSASPQNDSTEAFGVSDGTLKDKGGFPLMKTKTEFYKAYFEALQKKGFTVAPSISPDYVADIYRKDKLVAFCSKNDAIIKNPFLEVPAKLMEQLQTLAKSTAAACGICSEKPYDEAIAEKLSNNVYKINEHNGVALACKHHPLFEYVLSTYRKDVENGGLPIQRQYFYNKENAFESFAVRSGLIDEKKLFSETEMKIIHAGLVKMRTIDDDLTHDDLDSVERLVDKIEDVIPELQKKEKLFDFQRFFASMENELER